MSGITFCVCLLSWVFRHSGSHFKSFLSSQRAPCDWCHVETRTRHNLEWWISGGLSSTHKSGDVRSVQRGCLAIKIGFSGQSGERRQQQKSRPSQRKLWQFWLELRSWKFPSAWTRECESGRKETWAERPNPSKKWRGFFLHKDT